MKTTKGARRKAYSSNPTPTLTLIKVKATKEAGKKGCVTAKGHGPFQPESHMSVRGGLGSGSGLGLGLVLRSGLGLGLR